MLTDCMATRLPSADNLAVAIGQFGQQIQVLIVDVHRSWPFAVNVNRVLLGGFAGCLALFRGIGFSLIRSWIHWSEQAID